MITIFSYGSNMATRRLLARVPDAQFGKAGYVSNYHLEWTKSGQDGSGKCTLVPKAGAIAWGVLARIPQSGLETLDRIEGLGHGYHAENLSVITESGTVTARAYIADPNAINPHSVPFDWYHNHVLTGACEQGLPTAYIAQIKAVRYKPDLDSARRAREYAVYDNLK